MYRILLVEDAKDFQILVKRALASLHSDLVVVGSAADALKSITESSFDLVLLDLGLPDSDGFSLFQELQAASRARDVPIIFVTGKNSSTDLVTGFSLGAEDYITKPFDPLVFLARVEGRLKKIQSQRSRDDSVTQGNLLANLSQMKAYRVSGNDRANLKLTPTEFKLLYHLMRTPDRIYSREQLLGLAWGDDAAVFDRTVDTHISTLRKKLGEEGKLIEAVPNVGYRFIEKAGD